tara:strand:+ start:7307 stop:7612 length:306 start_codon:yes stop_codon:yes gene_type:complete
MPRFEMQLMYTETQDGLVETSEFEMICWVKDSSDLEAVQDAANSVIEDHLDEAKNIILFGEARIFVGGSPVMSIGFRNKNADSDEIESVIDLLLSEEEQIH